jgi:hypothetical protein
MSNLQSDLETVKTGIAKMLHFTLDVPKPPHEGGPKDYESYRKQMTAHTEASDKWAKEEGPKVAEAAFNVFAQFFKDINSIANGVNK